MSRRCSMVLGYAERQRLHRDVCAKALGKTNAQLFHSFKQVLSHDALPQN